MVYANMQYAWSVMIKNKPKRNRGSKDKTVYHSNTEKHETCCHRLHDLEGRRDPWWCSKVFCHSEAWEG